MKTLAIVQARMRSSRLPNKVMQPVAGVPMIDLLLQRLARAGQIDQILVATSEERTDDPLVAHVQGLGYDCFRGSESDVLDRYFRAAEIHAADIVVRITGDCPLVDPDLVEKALILFKESSVDYLSNTLPPTYPDGLDIEVFSFAALRKAAEWATSEHEREHVTPQLRDSGRFSTGKMENNEDFSYLRWTVDEPPDLEVIRTVFDHFGPSEPFGWREVLALNLSQPELFRANQHIRRNEGGKLGAGQKLWKRAKHLIPGGNMLLSKRPEMFLPDQWPAYFSRAKGCSVWDLDGVEYTDMSIMGIGTNTLGYGQAEVDDAVRGAIEAGNMSTLNCPEEVQLAETLIALHPWAEMVRFARTGGEANAVAIRIARAVTGREKVAVCGYHGWHDWYLAANLADEESLNSHLLPGLEPNGVPASLRGTTIPFKYNDFEQLESLVAQHDLGAIKMEVVRSAEPEEGFLRRVRELATNRGIVLIFDECTSGFRETNGGIHKKYGVEPDLAILGKALGNGYAITAIIGRREVMLGAQSSFISSTFWTERIGPVAALKTLEVMERERSWEEITKTGRGIRSQWQALAERHGLRLEHWGIPALAGFTVASPRAQEYKTLISQEMLARGFLAANSVYVSTAHTPDVISGYFDALDQVFSLIADCEDGLDVQGLLNGPVCHSGFSRLN